MNQYKSNLNVKIEAIQFTKENKTQLFKEHKFMALCHYNEQSLYTKESQILPYARDIMGTPKNAFYGIKIGDIWNRLDEGSWIIKKDEQYLTIPNGLFQLLFSEVTTQSQLKEEEDWRDF